jgi:hypothetical protein
MSQSFNLETPKPPAIIQNAQSHLRYCIRSILEVVSADVKLSDVAAIEKFILV